MSVSNLTKSWSLRFVLLAFAVLTTNAQTTNPALAASAGTEAWKELLAARDSFYESSPPSLEPKDVDDFLKGYADKAGRLADRFKDYQTHYPESPDVSEAWNEWMNLLDIAAHGSAARRTELEEAEQRCLSDPKLTPRQRSSIRYRQIDRLQDLAERERLVRKLKDEDEESIDFCGRMLDIAEFSEYPHSREIVDEILELTGTAPTVEEYRATGHTSTNELALKIWIASKKANRDMHQRRALELKKRLDRIGQPLQLQFTALDGTQVDLEQYRGKVVLLDFWATWCPPCVGGLPVVKAVWQSLHKDGFEVIGMSYDDERETLERFLKKNELPWPQFFDPAGMGASLVQSLGQPGPPAYWLIDRQGLVSDLNAYNNLEKKVRQLLGTNAVSSKSVLPK